MILFILLLTDGTINFFQTLCFCLFLGPIRIVLFAFLASFGILVIQIIRFFVHYFKLPFEVGVKTCFFFGQLFFKSWTLGSGIVWTSVKGKPDPEARFWISNHVSLSDPFVYLAKWYLSPVIRADVEDVVWLNRVIEVTHPVYVKRDQAMRQTDFLAQRANSPNCGPVMVYPEGTISGGKYVLKFRRGGFLTNHKIQLICLRYHSPLVPAGWNTHEWKDFSFYQHFWCLFSMPFGYATIEFLDPIQNDDLSPEGIEKFAVKAQIQMANALGVPAVQQNNQDLFRVLKEFKKE